MKEFKSFGAFANHLRLMAIETPMVTAEIAERAGKVVEKRAKDEIGHYQTSAGEFPAWAPLTSGTEARKAALGFPADAPLLASGEMRDSISHAVIKLMTGARVIVGSNDEKLIFHEFGTSKMPPRPVLGPALFNSHEDIERIAAEVMFAFLSGQKWKKGK